MGNEKNVHTLIERAWGQIAGWRHRPIPRAAWHTADEIMVEAARLDFEATREAWEQLALWYETQLDRENDTYVVVKMARELP